MSDETAAFLRQLEASLPAAGTEVIDVGELRRLAASVRRPPGPPIGAVEDVLVPNDDGAGRPIRCRVYRPFCADAGQPAAIFLHGGGWVQGDLDSHDALCRRLALGANIVLVAVDYRRAPEHPFPAPIDDVVAVAHWLDERAAELGIDRCHLGVIGESAGGNIAAASMLALRDRCEPLLNFQVLLYPALDHSFDTASYREFSTAGGLLTEARMRWYWAQYLGDADGSDPLASPLRAELHDLAPSYILVAECDPLRDEGESYGARLRTSGVDVTVVRADGAFHAFLAAGGRLQVADRALADVCAWIRLQCLPATEPDRAGRPDNKEN